MARFCRITRAAAQLEKTNQQQRDATDSGGLRIQLDSHSGKDYRGDKDVFLSHSGKQKNFVRQLYQDLTREHLSCFFDEDEGSLPLAQKFPPLIFKAAETCKIAVLVLSKDFIRSKWPMIELAAFINAKKTGKNANLNLLPIFFMISPKELKHFTKNSPEWKKLEKSDGRRREWQEALKEVRPVHGLVFREDENEVDFRGKVVKAICCLLKPMNPESPLQLLDFEPVGIEEQVLEVKAMLDMEGAPSALAIIVYGFGGLGKSTLAASVLQSFDWSTMDFKFCRVEIDEKTPDKTSHIIQLQKNILYDLGGGEAYLRDPHDGRHKIKEVLKKKCCLLFIDNVVDKDYVSDLLPKDLPSREEETKLRIIITSRDKYVRAELKIMCKEYEVKCLSNEASKSLLSKSILQSQEQSQVAVKDNDFDEERMINDVAYACRGVPLLLSVFGKHLRLARNKNSYQEALDVLREGNLDNYKDEDLGTKLMFVYDKIKEGEVKEVFLDICIYFHGWEWDLVADIVDCPKLDDLYSRMLVSKSGSGKVIVHDILRLMGMNKANLTRFSNYKKLSDAMEDNLDGLGMKHVKGISLLNDKGLITIQSTELEAMRQSLRVLMLGDWVTLEGPPCQTRFKNLRYLGVGDITAFPFKDLSKLEKLRVFLNRSKFSHTQFPLSLKRIYHELPHVECQESNETRTSVQLPEELHLHASVVHLDLKRFKNFPKDVGHLTALESLIMDRSDLDSLPQGFGKLKKLKHLSMDYCSQLSFLSEELGKLSSLETLSMKGCRNLRALPNSLGGLLSLQTLEFSECINLQDLPESLGELRIQLLNLSSLVDLKELPNSFGNMPLLKYLTLESCHSLMSLPQSFVRLKLLESLRIITCPILSLLPEDFGRLRCLKHMIVEECHLLKELPDEFGALPALKTFSLRWCNSFVNLPKDFTELTSLEKLDLLRLPLMSRIPDGMGKLKKLGVLQVQFCPQLKTLPDDFENMAYLRFLIIRNCSELDGAMMEKIVKLPNCLRADINGSRKLLEKWKHMQGETEHSIMVVCGEQELQGDMEEARREIKVGLLHGKCLEVNNATGQLMERSSLLVGLEEGIGAMVAVIMLPIHVQPHEQETLQQLVEMTRESAQSYVWGKLHIVCARKVELHAERPTPTEEEKRAEEEDIRQILLSLPKGSCAIPSSQSKRVQDLTRYFQLLNHPTGSGISSFMRNLEVDMIFTPCDQIYPPEMKAAENKYYNSIQNFINSICCSRADGESERECVGGENKRREFMEALKGSGIHHLFIHNNNNTTKVMVDDLHEKTIGLIICDSKFFESVKLQQIYKDIQQKDSNFILIWIPTVLSRDCGHGTYTRLIQRMPWATFPHPQLVNVEHRYLRFVVLDKHGQIANHDALTLLLAWGVKSYPFIQHIIPESFSLVESESCLEFLLHGMNIVGRKPTRSKMTFLYAYYPLYWCRMKSKLEELTQIDGSFEILYVGKFLKDYNIGNLKEAYEYATQNMRWPSLSFSDMIMFWYRCKYLASEEGYQLYKKSNIMMETLHGLAKKLHYRGLVLVENDGPVTYGGHDVVKMICESSDEIRDGEGMGMRMVKDELMKSLSRGECSPIVKTFFRDEIHDLPQHPQHPIRYDQWDGGFKCDVCGGVCVEQRSYWCSECKGWHMCGRCWMAYAKQQVEQLVHPTQVYSRKKRKRGACQR